MIKPNLLTNAFCEKEIPPFPCPRCQASLLLVKDTLHLHMSAESAFLRRVGALNFDEGNGVFSLQLKCTSTKCEEAVAACGDYSLGAYEPPDSPDTVIEAFLRPRSFTPPLMIFPIPASCPERTKKALTASFAVFWTSPDAAGNGLRTSIEAFLDYQSGQGPPRPNE